jgi:2-methylcitrate dehydratase PrpD
VTRELGHDWLLTETQIKPYPFCQLSVASIDALRQIRPTLHDLSEVGRITFDVPAEIIPIVCEPTATKVRPRTPYEAKFSLQWCAGALLVDGKVGVETFDQSQLSRPEVLAIAEKVAYQPYDSDVAAANAPGRVEVETKGGARRAEAAVATGATPEMIDEKLALNVGDEIAASELARLVRGLDREPNLDNLGRAIRGRPARVTS